MDIKKHTDELRELIKSVGTKMIKNLVVEHFVLLNHFVLFFIVVYHLVPVSVYYSILIPYLLVFIGLTITNVFSIVRHISRNKVFSINKSDIEHLLTTEFRDGMLAHLLFRLNEKSQKLEHLKHKIDIVKSVGGIQHRGIAKTFFVISIMLFIYSALNIAFLQYYAWNPDIVFDQMSYFLMVKWSLFTILLVMGIFSVVLYKMIWGLKDVNICSSCRRIEWDGDWYTLENFIGRPSHDICPICSDAFVRDVEKKVNKAIQEKEKSRHEDDL
jgi:hypothetical protein